jgi:NAD(P)-dependent dehydrogenase (short-subunit alcohol dehydrogenase family)
MDMAISQGTILLVGASRGLGLAMAEEFLSRGWQVIGTVRGADRTPLHDLADAFGEQLEIAQLDITVEEQIAALRDRFHQRKFDILFVNAGTTNANQNATIAEVTTDEFQHVMLTNALSPMRVIETFDDLVHEDGLIGVMSSGQGSIANNETGGREVYRGTKAALNQYVRSYAARDATGRRALVLIAPGWVKTELGGPDAPFTIAESIPKIVDVIVAKQARPGLEYLDRNGKIVPW